MEPSSTERLDIALAALRKCEVRSLAGQFALEVMHEIRNPLDAIGNLVHLSEQTDDLKMIHQYMRDAAEQIVSLHQIAGQSLALARSGQTEKAVDLMELVETAIRVHHRRVTAKRISVRRDMLQSVRSCPPR
jgi:signal transduction histidine kinase